MKITHLDMSTENLDEVVTDLKLYDHKAIKHSMNLECQNENCQWYKFGFLSHIETSYTPVGYIIDNDGRYGIVKECDKCFEKFYYHSGVVKNCVDSFKKSAELLLECNTIGLE